MGQGYINRETREPRKFEIATYQKAERIRFLGDLVFNVRKCSRTEAARVPQLSKREVKQHMLTIKARSKPDEDCSRDIS